MAEASNPKEFPDVTQKLTAPKKLSAFERERQAAAAKQQRAEAENARALKAFEDSFADEDDDAFYPDLNGGRGPPMGPSRGFDSSDGRYGRPPPGPRSGPGSLGPGPAPPLSLKRKRALDEMREAQEARREQDMYSEPRSSSKDDGRAELRIDEREDDTPRLEVQLSSLPPMISADEITSLLKPLLHVSSVRLLPPAGPGLNARRSATAIVRLPAETSISQVDSAISSLKNKYLRCGFYLSLSRHLQSATLHPSMTTTTTSSEPFAAEKSRERHPRFSMRNAPPPMEHRGFAPPESYETPSRHSHGLSAPPGATVSVRPPLDIEQIKAVHTIVDQLLLEPEPERALEIEAMLMALPDVQRDERFAFLYDSRSPAGQYYRFLLWAPEDPDEAVREMKHRARGPERIHEDVAIDWMPPHPQLLFPDLKSLAEVVTDMDYISSEEESDDDDGDRQFNSGRDGEGLPGADEVKHLSPLKRARLVYLLSRLPTSNARLRKGDVARITNFAINNAGPGAEEIVDTLVLNIERPFSNSLAATYEDQASEQDEEDEYEPDEDLVNLGSPVPTSHAKESKRETDPSGAKLIGLYVISDILSASSTAGARNAWKYRQLFELAFKARKSFEHLGKLEKELAWGRLKAEQWKRRLSVIFGIWEGWSVFPNEVQEEFKSSFFEPPLSEEEKAAVQAEAEKEEKKKQEEKWMGKFKKVERSESNATSLSPAPPPVSVGEVVQPTADVDNTPMDDVDGMPMEDVDGAPMDGIDGQPMDEDHIDGVPMTEGGERSSHGSSGFDPARDTSITSVSHGSGENGKNAGPRRRMKAEDMFGDSDEN